jgi:hypothetical protein
MDNLAEMVGRVGISLVDHLVDVGGESFRGDRGGIGGLDVEGVGEGDKSNWTDLGLISNGGQFGLLKARPMFDLFVFIVVDLVQTASALRNVDTSFVLGQDVLPHLAKDAVGGGRLVL